MKLSVCMATYNGAQLVARQLDSVLKQLNENDQVVIVDDGSKDGTPALLKERYGERVEVYVNEQNIGVIQSFEKAIQLAEGDIIFLCDQDDIWEDNKVEKVLDAFKKQDAMLVAHDAYVVDKEEKILHHSWNEYNHNKKQGFIGNIIANSFTGCCMAFKRELVSSFLPFPVTIEMHDQWIALVCMMKKKKIVYIDEPLMKYVRHGNNVTAVKKRSLSEKLRGRIGTITAVARYKN